ncbi:glyoxalase bleomycin resistance dioxygenase [Trichoderma arundinaceum]|uniref:Glyoxalase bleomycin resistance dioxygenase n=1 Tax=Trichoderma arundinaceum TaxID=490622 RepID=A0A395NT32_TRIAR|nr:glyoxalase bleomycin resistance dioxygenase [Trichoderma arundinaceum]
MSNLTKKSSQIPPSRLAHVVLRTSNLKEMSPFYKTFLGGEAQVENDQVCFITYDDEHHRIALVQRQDLNKPPPKSCGLDHIAFGFDDIESLLKAYTQRKENEIKPVWCVHHGLTISMYYKDPDGNTLETFIDAFHDLEKQNAYMTSQDFIENPIGVDFEPEDLLKRLEDGEDKESIYKRPNIGPRDLSTVPLF